MTANLERISTTITDVFQPETGTTHAWLRAPLLRLLARGEPAAIDALAAATGHTTDEVRQALAASPDIEYDDTGRILAAGISLRPTPHHFTVDGTRLYTWCAMDTLVFPAILGRPAQVESPCQTTGTLIRLVVEPDRVGSVDPATAVVSIVTPEDLTSIRTAFCNQVHFFASPEAAHPWLADHPDAGVLPVAEAYQLGRSCTQTADDAAGSKQCC